MKVLDRRQEQLRNFGELFDKRKWPNEEFDYDPRDITERKHGGNECSTAAHVRLAPSLRGARQSVFDLIRDSGERGMTCDEIAAFLCKGENAVSGPLLGTKARRKNLQIRDTQNSLRVFGGYSESFYLTV